MTQNSKIKIALINIIVFAGMIVSAEVLFNIFKYIDYEIISRPPSHKSYKNKKKGELIPTRWEHVFHPGVGHSHQEFEFRDNANTSELIFDNISSTETFQGSKLHSSSYEVLVLGGSTTDPLNTHTSGYRGTWVHHLFEDMTKENRTQYVVDNAGNGGATSSNELLRLITKLHNKSYDLVISYNGINEIYFSDNPYLQDKENILASPMLVYAINEYGVIKTMHGKTFWALDDLRQSSIYQYLKSVLLPLKNRILRSRVAENNPTKLSEKVIRSLHYAAEIWDKNISFMNSASRAMGSKYVAVLQPTLGLDGNYCKNNREDCMLRNQSYILKIRYLYSLMRQYCKSKEYCIDISKDGPLISDDKLYSDPRHPNSQGNKRVAGLIRSRLSKTINN